MLFLLDMDGVVCNFIDGLIKSHGWPIKHDDYASWDFHRTFGVTDEEMWESTNDGKWWLGLEEYPWAKVLVTELRRRGEVVFCTSPSLDSSCPSQKVQWLRNHALMHPRRNDYQIGGRKELNAKSGAILIDDSEDKVAKYIEHGGEAILFPQPWNSNRDLISRRFNYVRGGVKILSDRPRYQEELAIVLAIEQVGRGSADSDHARGSLPVDSVRSIFDQRVRQWRRDFCDDEGTVSCVNDQ